MASYSRDYLIVFKCGVLSSGGKSLVFAKALSHGEPIAEGRFERPPWGHEPLMLPLHHPAEIDYAADASAPTREFLMIYNS